MSYNPSAESGHTLGQAVFPPEYEALRPFFNRHTQWGKGGGQEHLAYRTLKDHFPLLGPQEIFLIVITAKRLFQGSQDTY